MDRHDTALLRRSSSAFCINPNDAPAGLPQGMDIWRQTCSSPWHSLGFSADILNCLRIIIDPNFLESIYIERDVELRNVYYIIIWVIHIISTITFVHSTTNSWQVGVFFHIQSLKITQLVGRDAPLGTRSANVVGFHTLAPNKYILKWLVDGDFTSHPWSRPSWTIIEAWLSWCMPFRSIQNVCQIVATCFQPLSLTYPVTSIPTSHWKHWNPSRLTDAKIGVFQTCHHSEPWALDPIESCLVSQQLQYASVLSSSSYPDAWPHILCQSIPRPRKQKNLPQPKKEWIHPMHMWPQNMQIEPTMAPRMVGFWCLAISSRFSPEIHLWSMLCRFLAPSYFGML